MATLSESSGGWLRIVGPPGAQRLGAGLAAAGDQDGDGLAEASRPTPRPDRVQQQRRADRRLGCRRPPRHGGRRCRRSRRARAAGHQPADAARSGRRRPCRSLGERRRRPGRRSPPGVLSAPRLPIPAARGVRARRSLCTAAHAPQRSTSPGSPAATAVATTGALGWGTPAASSRVSVTSTAMRAPTSSSAPRMPTSMATAAGPLRRARTVPRGVPSRWRRRPRALTVARPARRACRPPLIERDRHTSGSPAARATTAARRFW